MAGTGATASQAWAILKRHARDEMSPLRLQELCRDNDRVSSLVAVYNATPQRMLIVDLSRQRMTLETLNHLLRLATARHIQKYITQLAWGQNDPDDPIVPLRVLQQQQAQARQQGNHHNHPTQYQPYHQQYTHQGPVPTVLSDERHRKTTRFEEADEAGGARQQQQQYRTPVPSFSGEGHSSHRHNNHNNHQNNTNDTTATTTPHIPVIPSLHLSLRAPAGQGLEILTANGVNALTAIHSDWERMQRISESLRRGQWPGITGHAIKDVVVVGRGVAIMALRFVYLALLKDETAVLAQRAGFGSSSGGRRVGGAGTTGSSSTTLSSSSATTSATTQQQQQQHPQTTAPFSYFGQRRIKFLTSVDPIRAAAVVADLDPASTIVISLALQGNEETILATQTLKTWLLQSLGGAGNMTTTSSAITKRQEIVLSKHMMLVTGNDHLAAATHVPESSVFVLPEHSRCEAFTSFTAATLLVSFVRHFLIARVCARLLDLLQLSYFVHAFCCANLSGTQSSIRSIDRLLIWHNHFFFGLTTPHTTALVHCVRMVYCRTVFGGRP